MKHKILVLAPLIVVLLLLSVSSVAAEVNAVTPSTNDINRTNHWAHFEAVPQPGAVELTFISERNFYSCFEIRVDGDTSQQIRFTNPNTTVIDGTYPYFCVRNNTLTRTVAAKEYVEVRMVFGAERDERFDWTRVDVGVGCSIIAPVTVNEGASFTASVVCNGANDVYGFQLGTSSTSNITTAATHYTPGSFVTDVDPNFVGTINTLSDYAVSRRAPAEAADGNFSLGSLVYTAPTGLIASEDATLTLNPLLLGNELGTPITAAITSPTTITIRDLLTLNLTIASDGTVTKVRDVIATVDGVARGPETSVPPDTTVMLNFTDVIGTSLPVVSADMKGHLECTGTLASAQSLSTSVSSRSLVLLAGDVILNSGDTVPTINNFDATAVGWSFGQSVTGDRDINGDGTVDIYDLIHVGRNYGAVRGVCSLS